MGSGTFQIADEYLTFSFTQDQEIVFIPVRSNVPVTEWKLTSSDDSWCKVSKSYNNQTGLMLAVLASEEPEMRSATITASAGGPEYKITVQQLGYGPAILVSNVGVPAEGGSVNLKITSNIEYTVGDPQLDAQDAEGWITAKSDEETTRAFADRFYSYTAEPNMLPYKRIATISVTPVDPQYKEVAATCTLTQEPQAVESSAEDLDDEEVQALSATANQAHAGNGPEFTIDGDMSTNYHSPWQLPYDNPTTQFPVELEYTFDGTKSLDYIRLYSGTGNGRPGNVVITYLQKGASDYTAIFDASTPYNLQQKGGEQTITFPERAQNVEKLKLSFLDGAGDNGAGGGFISINEIEFYHVKRIDLNEPILKVFTDLSCMELREGVTRQEITALYGLSPYLAQEVAVPLMEGSYEANEYDFRAHSYEPYSNNEINLQLLTKMYSRMDNPTGIEVKAGDKILVCVDKVPAGQSLSLAVYGEASDGYGPNYGGTSQGNAYDTVDQEVQLLAGMNSIDITAPGMCYVMNTASNLSSASEPVKVHILRGCGTVQGYFDLARHQTDEKYQELLAKCTYKYFVVKGHKMIFNFHTSQLRSDAPTSIVSGIQAWDDILTWQQELMGLDDCEYFNNHIMAVSSTNPNAYMDASNRRVNFSASTALYKIITLEQLLAVEDNSWGPAHEVGHINQGAINWKSASESSNNLFSNYVIYKMGKYGSRGDKLSELALSWAEKETWALLGDATHQGEDTELHMRMNWQLWIYYHLCGFDTEFWPKLFQLLRDDPLPSEFSSKDDPGASQLKFYVKACDAAKQDLTEFFETWGFFRPLDINYSQYGEARYYVTDEMIAEAKAQVAAKGYPKAAPIQYIEDRQVKDNDLYCDMGYYTIFKDKKKITKTPSCTVSGRTYTVSNCEEAVAVEIRKVVGGKMGDVVYFSNLSSFTVPDKADLNGTKPYAVQADGERILINM